MIPTASRPLRHRYRPWSWTGLLLMLAGTAAVCTAHEWTSPPVPPKTLPLPAWSEQLWAGPRSGPPAAPSAADCHRAPRLIELSSGAPAIAQARRDLRDGGRAGAAPLASMPAPLMLARSERVAEVDALAGAAKSATPSGVAPAVAPAAPAQPADRRALSEAPARARPADEAVTAGVIDDNADFGAYLAFANRHAQLPLRQRDVSERYLLTVHDAAGRVVPDARVTLHAGGKARPLWARTDAGGQVWLHPRAAGLAEAVLEVQVHKPSADGELRGSALLRRGQRDALQVRLDANAPLQGARLDLVFLVDATGSMTDEIDKLRASMSAMADQIGQLPSRPQICFGLVAYRDRGDAFFVRAHDFTDDLGAFQQVLGGLRAGGGGDYPEALNEALHTTVHRLSWRGDGATRLVVLVADAPPHLDYGSPWYDDDMQGALARGIKLFAVGASGLDRSGEVVFRQLAQYTGGRFVFLTYADANNPASGPGRETGHDVGNYSVESLDKLVVRLVREELARRPA